MRNQTAKVANLLNLITSFTESEESDPGVPCMGLLYSPPGLGKTTATAYTVNLTGAIYLRATALWTPTAMLTLLLAALGASPLPSAAKMLMKAVELMSASRRGLFVDEGDYLFSNLKMLDTLRDLHDLSHQPIWIIGMNGIERRMIHQEKLARRIGHWIEFRPCSLQDTVLLAETVCEVKVREDLLVKLTQDVRGSIGRVTLGLAQIERFAKEQQWEEIGAGEWNDRSFLPLMKNQVEMEKLSNQKEKEEKEKQEKQKKEVEEGNKE